MSEGKGEVMEDRKYLVEESRATKIRHRHANQTLSAIGEGEEAH